MSDYFLGLDLGQTTDFSALVVLERVLRPRVGLGIRPPPEYHIRHLHRYELGTTYTNLIEQVVALLNRPARQGTNVVPLRGCLFGLDQTGVGRPVVDMFRVARPPCRLQPVTITAGSSATLDADGWKVPKKDLVAAVQVLLQGRRLKWDARLSYADILSHELADFQVRITPAANEQFGVWREGQHDDLVLAVAIACWLAERNAPVRTSKPFAHGGMANVFPTLGPPPNGFRL